MRGKKKYLAAKYIGKKCLALHFYMEKNLSCSPGRKNIIAQSESSNPPSKVKWSTSYLRCLRIVFTARFQSICIVLINCYIHVRFLFEIAQKSQSENLHYMQVSPVMLIFLPRFQALLLFC